MDSTGGGCGSTRSVMSRSSPTPVSHLAPQTTCTAPLQYSLASQPYFSEWCTHARQLILRGRVRKNTSGNCRQVFVSATQNLVVQSGARCHVIIHNVYNFHVIVGSRLQQLTELLSLSKLWGANNSIATCHFP